MSVVKVGRKRKKKIVRPCPTCGAQLKIEKVKASSGFEIVYTWPRVIVCPACDDELQVR